MLLLIGYLVICIGVVFGAPETSMIDGCIVTIDNHSLKSVVKTSNTCDNLDLSDLQLIDIDKANAFVNTSLSQLVLSNNNLENSNFIATLPTSLRGLKLSSNKLVELIPGAFRSLTSLDILKLDGNNLTSLAKGVFDGLWSLEVLYLNGNHLTGLPEGVFDGLANVLMLYLFENYLTNLTPGVFDGLESLESLYINDNNLTSLPVGVFDRLGKLSRLSLRNNKITAITPEEFRSLPNGLAYLNLGFNRITKLKSGTFINKKLEDLNLKNNRITEIENGTFNLPKLFILNLNGNLLTTLRNETFLGLPHVGILYLSLNNIETIEAGAFSHLLPIADVCRDDTSSFSRRCELEYFSTY